MADRRLPLTVIGGFLGAGKTTLLNHLLHASQGRRLAVLVNDFGSLDIDAELISSRGADAIALSNGCVCCSIGDDLSAALMRVLDGPHPFDAVVIEASGVSDPWRIAQVGLADPGLSLGGVIVLVDASACSAQVRDPWLADSLERQIQAADWLLVNKVDLTDPAEQAQVSAWLDERVSATPRFETRHARLPPELTGALFGDLAAARRPVGGCFHGAADRHDHGVHASDHDHADPATHAVDHGSQFETASWQPQHTLSAEALRAMLRAMPPGVLRLKGLVKTDRHRWAEIQYAGRHGSLRKALREPAQGAAVVAIGLRDRLPVRALDAVFVAQQGATPAP